MRLAPGQLWMYCARCLDRRSGGPRPLAVVEPDCRQSATVDMDAQDWADLFVRASVQPHLEVWKLVRYGRRAAAMIGVAASAGMADRSPYLRAKRRTVRRTHTQLLPIGSSYELTCGSCGARPRVSAGRLRDVARRALAEKSAVRIEPSGTLHVTSQAKSRRDFDGR